ncbi:MAG TPA: hypothetical protein VFN11_17160 [Ktedonobacterales bacterium]|nr:hypothetical protein [Ktedonobacterales bacterium]
MAAAQEPQPNPYELHPHHAPRAEPGHVHRFVASGYVQRCIYCHVEETFALRAENDRLQRRVGELEGAMLAIYRETGSRYAAIRRVRDMLANWIALSQWPDEQRNDDD